MRLLWCMVMVAVVSGAAVIQHLDDANSDVLSRSLPVGVTSDEIEDDDRQAKNIPLASIPLAYHIPNSVPLQPFSYHVPGAVYNIPSPLLAPQRTPASTVLLPMLGQNSASFGIARNEGEVFAAAARGNAFDTCLWIFEQCTGIDVVDTIFPRTFSMPGVTPAYLRYGYGPVPSVQYPIHVAPQAGPVPVTYGAHFWCGIFVWKCLPDISNLPINVQDVISQGGLPLPIIG